MQSHTKISKFEFFTWLICCFQHNLGLIITPRNFNIIDFYFYLLFWRLPNNINFILFEFSDSLLISNQVFKDFISLSTVFKSRSRFFPEQHKLVSSANRTEPENVDTLEMSLM